MNILSKYISNMLGRKMCMYTCMFLTSTNSVQFYIVRATSRFVSTKEYNSYDKNAFYFIYICIKYVDFHSVKKIYTSVNYNDIL